MAGGMMKFVNSDNEAFYEYWHSLLRGGLIPDKTCFLPEDIPKLLPNITIYQLVSKEIVLIRLCGTQIMQRDGGDRKGENYLDYVLEFRRLKASQALWSVHDQPCAMRVIVNYKSNLGNIKRIESIGVPITDYTRDKNFLYYSSCEIANNSQKTLDVEEHIEEITVLQRDFIDIGAGVPDFKD